MRATCSVLVILLCYQLPSNVQGIDLIDATTTRNYEQDNTEKIDEYSQDSNTNENAGVIIPLDRILASLSALEDAENENIQQIDEEGSLLEGELQEVQETVENVSPFREAREGLEAEADSDSEESTKYVMFENFPIVETPGGQIELTEGDSTDVKEVALKEDTIAGQPIKNQKQDSKLQVGKTKKKDKFSSYSKRRRRPSASRRQFKQSQKSDTSLKDVESGDAVNSQQKSLLTKNNKRNNKELSDEVSTHEEEHTNQHPTTLTRRARVRIENSPSTQKPSVYFHQNKQEQTSSYQPQNTYEQHQEPTSYIQQQEKQQHSPYFHRQKDGYKQEDNDQQILGPKVFSLSSDLSEDEIISHLLSESNDEDINDEEDSEESNDHQSEDVRNVENTENRNTEVSKKPHKNYFQYRKQYPFNRKRNSQRKYPNSSVPTKYSKNVDSKTDDTEEVSNDEIEETKTTKTRQSKDTKFDSTSNTRGKYSHRKSKDIQFDAPKEIQHFREHVYNLNNEPKFTPRGNRQSKEIRFHSKDSDQVEDEINDTHSEARDAKHVADDNKYTFDDDDETFLFGDDTYDIENERVPKDIKIDDSVGQDSVANEETFDQVNVEVPRRPRNEIRQPAVGFNHKSSPVSKSGDYNFSYSSVDGQSRTEEGTVSRGAKAIKGSYSYTSPDGQLITMSYTADENGFQPVGSHIPAVAPLPKHVQRLLAHLAKVNQS